MSPTDEAIQKRWAFGGRNRNLPWYPRRGNRNELAQFFGTLGFVRGVEVGTRDGAFAKVLCDSNRELTLVCVDPWIAYSTRTQEWMDGKYQETKKAAETRKMELLRMRSLEAVHDFKDGSLDFVYIDGNHVFDHAVRDIIEWVPKVRKDGIVAVHDYNSFVGCDVILAVDSYTRAHGINPWYVTRELEPTAFWVAGELKDVMVGY